MRYSKSVLVAGAILSSLLLAGCAADAGAGASGDADGTVRMTEPATPEPVSSGVAVSVPSTTNRPSDAPLPSDYDQKTNNELTPAEASLGQLWAAANSEVGADADQSTFGAAGGLADFSAAITSRCYPILPADQVAELSQLKVGFEAATGNAAFEAGKAYFARATELCM